MKHARGTDMRLDMIGIVTADIQKSLAFYRRLGLEIPVVPDDENHVEITLENGLRFAWDALEMMKSFDPHITLQPHSVGAFLCSSPSEVDAKYAGLTHAGYESHLAPWDAFWGQRYATVRDPDGNTVDLFAPLEQKD
jgi:catechol 2,3-dioxygenase-like lactoylglutathione lyase family enzyme